MLSKHSRPVASFHLLIIGASIYLAQAIKYEDPGTRRIVKQVPAASGVSSQINDQSSAESGFGGGGGGGIEHSKYFQDVYMLQSGPKQFEFGHVCENPDEWEQRYEKVDYDKDRHQGKVRWGDKKGGYGEHYWDYNHAGHDGDGEGGYSDPVPSYTVQNEGDGGKIKRQLVEPMVSSSQRREYVDDDDKASNSGFVGNFDEEIGAVENFDIKKEGQLHKRNADKVENKETNSALAKARQIGQEIQSSGNPQLYFDLDSGKVIDEKTGKTYILQPFN